MTENKTEALKKKLDEEKAEREAQRLKEEKLKAEQEAKQPPQKAVLPVWVPYLAAAVVAFVVSLFLKNTVINTIICVGLGVLAFILLEQFRKKQLREAYIPGAEQFFQSGHTSFANVGQILVLVGCFGAIVDCFHQQLKQNGKFCLRCQCLSVALLDLFNGHC
jgi:C4-dicarboxylate transporter